MNGLAVGRARIDGFSHEGRSRRVLSLVSPAYTLRSQLSPSEYAVARLAVEGKTHDEIARRRSTSPRTIANQLASTYRKLHVSGQSELRARAVVEHARCSTTNAPQHSTGLSFKPIERPMA
ncbi:MAG: Bacterial regulatory protein luxR family [Labilithrix sp.]|nr:Bacterial regulatory protein luxR family [Labilithrix sp.]